MPPAFRAATLLVGSFLAERKKTGMLFETGAFFSFSQAEMPMSFSALSSRRIKSGVSCGTFPRRLGRSENCSTEQGRFCSRLYFAMFRVDELSSSMKMLNTPVLLGASLIFSSPSSLRRLLRHGLRFQSLLLIVGIQRDGAFSVRGVLLFGIRL